MQAGVRETKEETGVDCEVTGLVGIKVVADNCFSCDSM